VAALEQQMADPDLYQDQQRWKQASSEHVRLREQLDAAYGRWEELQDAP
jgi:ATP-binding cassette subfamily F protein 3